MIGLHLGNDLWSGLGGLGYELNALDRWQETLRLHADGHAYPQWEIVTPVQDEKGISHYVIFFEDISERKAAERRIQDLAFYDELTGLPNRRQLHETPDPGVHRCKSQSPHRGPAVHRSRPLQDHQ